MVGKKKQTDDANSKVLKSGELKKESGSGFLSGLGFSKPVEEKVVEEVKIGSKPKDDIIATKEDIVRFKPKEETVSFQSPRRNTNPQHGSANTNTNKWGYKKPYNNTQNKSHSGSSNYRGNTNGSTYSKSTHTTPVQETVKVVKEATTSQNLVKKQEVMISGSITVKEFSEKIGIPLTEVMKKLLANKIMVWINASLDFDTVSLIGEELWVTVKKQDTQMDVQSFVTGDFQSILDIDKEAENTLPRAPIVTIMGHVDHGKTSLLDYLRKTSIVSGEAGGITQSIGASVVEHNGQKITFIDTPGHELFTNLRARGAKLTNIAVVVVAADDGIMPQTAESIDHAKAAGVPIIIAITKIDKANNNYEQIKTDIAKHGLTPEERGGETQVIGVSSKTGQGIDNLLEAILLQSEMLDLKFNPKRSAVGIVLDAHKDPKQGVVSTIIVMTGTLKVGDIIVAYNTYGKVRRMQNWKGQNVQTAMWWDPVQILGITNLPDPGRLVEVVATEKLAQERITQIQQEDGETNGQQSAVQQFLNQLQTSGSSELRLIMKTDGSSSLEALKQAIIGMKLPEKISVKIIHADVGHISESDLALAQASQALVIGFSIPLHAQLKKKAQLLKVEIKTFDIIYELIDYLENLTLGMVEKEYREVVTGKLNVLAMFFKKGKEMVIGGKVIEGKIKMNTKFRIRRGEEMLTQNGELVSLQRDKTSVNEVVEGYECGMKIKASKKVQEGDIIEFYTMEEIV